MQGLGREFDLAVGLVNYDSNASAGTGKRVALQNAQALAVVMAKAAGVGTDVPVITLQEHSAASGGTSQSLARITTVYKKAAAAPAGTEAWAVALTQAASATATLTGEATNAGLYLFEIDGTMLSDGFGWVSVNIADTGAAGAQNIAVLYVLHGLMVQRKPTNLAATL